MREGLPLKEGAAELLAYLKHGEAKIAIGSSTRSDIVEMELRDAGLLKYFDVIVGGEMACASKPAPDIFLLAAEKLRAGGGGKIARKTLMIFKVSNTVAYRCYKLTRIAAYFIINKVGVWGIFYAFFKSL